jgi:YD repeat-containing protein
LYEADWFNQRVRRISSALPGFSVNDVLIASEDGTEVYVFDNGGKHLRTLDALTQAVRYQFSYDTEGRLITISDGDNNGTTVERDPGGNVRAIVGPYGQRTTVTVDANGYLASIKNPANEQNTFSYSVDGLITTMTNPRNHAWVIAYDNLGRLASDHDPAGGFKVLTRTETNDSFTVALGTALERTNRYEVISLPNGGRKRVYTYPTGLRAE